MNHHPKTETIAAFAAGALDEARAILIAAHVSMCAACRRLVADAESIGGAMLDDLAPEAMAANALDRFWERAGEQLRAPAARVPGIGGDIAIPASLRRHIDTQFGAVEWKTMFKGFSQAILDAKGYRPGALRLLKIDPGVSMPKHSHGDGEFTLILAGAYEDEYGVFARGDFADLDHEDTHSPTAVGGEPCICLIATNAPLVFNGVMAKIAQRFIGV